MFLKFGCKRAFPDYKDISLHLIHELYFYYFSLTFYTAVFKLPRTLSVCGIKEGSNFLFLHVASPFPKCHLLNALPFPRHLWYHLHSILIPDIHMSVSELSPLLAYLYVFSTTVFFIMLAS